MKYLIMMILMVLGCGGVERRAVTAKEVVEREVYEISGRGVRVSELNDRSVALLYRRGGVMVPYCGGVWVGGGRILTARHCLSGVKEMGEVMGGLDREVYYGVEKDFIGYNLGVRVERRAVLKYEDELNDLALLVAEESPSHGIVRVGEVEVGDCLHIVGHARGMQYSYVSGLVSAFREKLDGGHGGSYMQVSGFVAAGNSGSGAFNDAGELVGIASFVNKTPGVAFYISSGVIKEFIKRQ